MTLPDEGSWRSGPVGNCPLLLYLLLHCHKVLTSSACSIPRVVLQTAVRTFELYLLACLVLQEANVRVVGPRRDATDDRMVAPAPVVAIVLTSLATEWFLAE